MSGFIWPLAAIAQQTPEAQPPTTTNQDRNPNPNPNPTDETTTDKTAIDTATEANPETTSTPNSNAESSAAQPQPLGSAVLYRFTQSQQNALILAEITTGEPITLQASDADFLAHWQSESSGKPKGAALIVPTHNTNPSQRHELANLQHYLSTYGWANLTLSLPAQNSILPPQRPAPPPTPIKPDSTQTKEQNESKNAEQIESQNAGQTKQDTAEQPDSALAEQPTAQEQTTVFDNDPAQAINPDTTAENNTPQASTPATKAPVPQEPIALARIAAGINYLQDQSQFNNVIIAEGTGVARAIHFLNTLADNPTLTAGLPEGITLSTPIRAFIMINAEHTLNELPALDITGRLTALNIPVLDIHTRTFHRDFAHAKQQLNARKKDLAKREGGIYVHRVIEGASIGQKGEHRLTRVIRGFLYQHAQGEEGTL